MSPFTFRRKMIRGEKTLGERLARARHALKASIAEAEAATQIRSKYLLALEDNRFGDLPEEVYTLGFIRRYSQFLGLDQEALTRQYRVECLAVRKRSQKDTSSAQHIRLSQMKPLARVVVTPKLFWVTTSLAVVLGVAGYIWYQVQGFVSAPTLEVQAPSGLVSSPTVAIEGRTDGRAVVTINSEPIPIDPEGNFIQEVRLTSGMNTIEVAARNRLNKETKREVRILTTY